MSAPVLDERDCEEEEQPESGDGAAQDKQAIGRTQMDALSVGLKGAEDQCDQPPGYAEPEGYITGGGFILRFRHFVNAATPWWIKVPRAIGVSGRSPFETIA